MKPLLGHAARAVAAPLGAAALVLLALELAPGTPADLVPGASEVLAERWGLERSALQRVIGWFGRLLTGDLGTSWAVRPGASVTELVAARSGDTAWLLLAAVPWVVVSSRVPRGIRPLSAIPLFLLGALAIDGINGLVFAGIDQGLAPPAWFALPAVDHPVRTGIAGAVLGIGSGLAADFAADLAEHRRRLSHARFVEVRRVHGEPLALGRHHTLAYAAAAARHLPALLGGTIVVERVFSLGGLGDLLWRAAELRDFDVAMAVAWLAGLVVSTARFAERGFAVAIDPRERGR